jgi:hypothetical protein
LEVPVGKNKGKAKVKGRPRKATFVQGKKHLDLDALTVMPKSANVVHRTELNADAPHVELGKTVFYKPHHNGEAPSQYAVASTRLANFLKIPEIISHNSFARVTGSPGIVSWGVPGSPLLTAKHDREVWPGKDFSKRDIDDWKKQAGIDERDGRYYAVSEQTYQWVDFKRPEIQKGLSDLQLFDAITGQTDRHGGNIFIDPTTGQVSGIDDDRSFGRGIKVSAQVNPWKHYTGLPDLVDKGTAEKILAVKPDDLREQLEAAQDDTETLTDQEIDDAVQRLVNVQSYLQLLDATDQLVTNWNDATYEKARKAPDKSYLGRSARNLDEAVQRSAQDPDILVRDAPPPPDPTPPPGGMPVLPPPPPPLRRRGLGFTVPQPTTDVPAPDPGLPTAPARQLFSPRTQDATQAARFRLGAVREKPSGAAVLTARRPSDLDLDDADTTESEEDGNPPSE